MENNERKAAGLLVGLVIACFLFFGLKDLYQRSRLKKEGIYTIGEITKVVDDHHSAPTALYEFKYKSVKYKGGVSINKIKKSLISRRFFVTFLPDAPDKSRMLLDKLVPSSLRNAPLIGWKELPE